MCLQSQRWEEEASSCPPAQGTETPRRPTSRQPTGGSRYRTARKKKTSGLAEVWRTVLTPCAPGSSAERREKQGTLAGPPGQGLPLWRRAWLSKASISKTREQLTFYSAPKHAGHRSTHSDTRFPLPPIACALSFSFGPSELPWQRLSRNKISASGWSSLERWREGRG